MYIKERDLYFFKNSEKISAYYRRMFLSAKIEIKILNYVLVRNIDKSSGEIL